MIMNHSSYTSKHCLHTQMITAIFNVPWLSETDNANCLEVYARESDWHVKSYEGGRKPQNNHFSICIKHGKTRARKSQLDLVIWYWFSLVYKVARFFPTNYRA